MATSDMDDMAELDDAQLPEALAGFAQVYQSRLRRQLAAIDARKTQAKTVARWWIVAGVAVAIIIAIISHARGAMDTSAGEQFWIILAVLVGVLICFQGWRVREKIKIDVLETVLGAAAEHVGLRYSRKFKRPKWLKLLRETRLVPMNWIGKFEDHFLGTYSGVPVEAFEAKLQRIKLSRRSTPETVFWGLCFRIKLTEPNEYSVAFLRKERSAVVLRQPSNMVPQSSGDAAMDQAFDMFVNHPDALEAYGDSRPLFDALLALRASEVGAYFRCALLQGVFVGALETQNEFELRTIEQSLASVRVTRFLLDDFTTLLGIFDRIVPLAKVASYPADEKDN